jgi:hypothetical protein
MTGPLLSNLTKIVVAASAKFDPASFATAISDRTSASQGLHRGGGWEALPVIAKLAQ